MPAPSTLLIRHIPDSGFQVVRLRDGKTTEPAAVVSPVGFPVEGRPDSDLMRELQWYLETFLEYPFPPETDHAERVRDALRRWGEQAFEALFDSRGAGRMFDAATSDAYARLHLQVSSDDPRVLSWPWEALYDPEVGHLAHTCQIERTAEHRSATRSRCRTGSRPSGSTSCSSPPGRTSGTCTIGRSPGLWSS